MLHDSSIDAWLGRETARAHLQTQRIHPDQSRQWRFDAQGCLAHQTGKFFRVVGIDFFDFVKRRWVTQPIIDQPEVGILCFLVARSEQSWWLLAQAKVEPGNVNGAQLAPTVQATKSNYQRVHGGKSVPYLQTAQHGNPVLYDEFQSEQNSRFLRKRNRNKVVQVERCEPSIDDRFLWLHLMEVLQSLRQSNMVNTDARSVLACWLMTSPQVLRSCLDGFGEFAHSFCDSLEATNSKHSRSRLKDWLDDVNRRWPQRTRPRPLHEMEPSWRWDNGTFVSTAGHVLQVRHLSVRCDTREVSRWDQPILASNSRASLITLIGRINGALHLLLQARQEAGNYRGFELTTTIQVDAWTEMSEQERQYAGLLETQCTTLAKFENSEEGGRFDRCISEYRICWADDVNRFEEGPFHRWVSLRQTALWLQEPNRLTNELRSTLSALLSVGE